MRKNLVLLLLSIILASSCDKGLVKHRFIMSAKIDGNQWTAIQDSSQSYSLGEDANGPTILRLEGKDSSKVIWIQFPINDNALEGYYFLMGGTDGKVIVSQGGEVITYSSYFGCGETYIEDNAVVSSIDYYSRGSFEFRAVNDSNSIDTIRVSNGKYEIDGALN